MKLLVVDKILGCSHQEGKGIAFVLPIDAVIGVGKES